MNIDSLKCFILVAENLSFARAAKTLFKTQPAVTKQISALEQELGVPLFLRSTRHVELTPAGMSFYKDAKDIVQNAQTAIERAQRQNITSNTINIGLSTPTLLFYLTPLLSRFHTDYPEIRPNIQVLSYKIILNLFMENKLDVLFFYKENTTLNSGINFFELEKDSFVCLMPAGHPFETRESISLQDLKGESIILCNPLNAPLSTASLQQKLLEQHSCNNMLYHDSVEIAHCMVASGMGVSILPGILCPKALEFSVVPLDDQAKLSFGVFYHKQNGNTALQQFLKLLNASAPLGKHSGDSSLS